jgi:hypothetical protein
MAKEEEIHSPLLAPDLADRPALVVTVDSVARPPLATSCVLDSLEFSLLRGGV